MTNIACDKPLGLQSGWVENSQMTASTVWDWKHAAWRGRLHMPKQGTFRGSWSAKYNNQDQWLQVCEIHTRELKQRRRRRPRERQKSNTFVGSD